MGSKAQRAVVGGVALYALCYRGSIDLRWELRVEIERSTIVT